MHTLMRVRSNQRKLPQVFRAGTRSQLAWRWARALDVDRPCSRFRFHLGWAPVDALSWTATAFFISLHHAGGSTRLLLLRLKRCEAARSSAGRSAEQEGHDAAVKQ